MEISEQLWYYSRSLPTSTSSTIENSKLHYAMPALSPHQVAQIISNTKVRRLVCCSYKYDIYKCICVELLVVLPISVFGILGNQDNIFRDI